MGSSVSGRYTGTRGSSEPKGGITYNTAHSNEVRKVEVVTNGRSHNVPVPYLPNSVYRNHGKNGLLSERYYNSGGEPYLDIDYTNHGNAKRHPIVPHQHSIEYENNKLNRESKGRKIR